MVDNITQKEYEQKQRQSYFKQQTRERREAEAELEEEEEPWGGTETVAYLPNQQNIQARAGRQERISRWMGMALIVTAVFVDIVELIMMDTGLDVVGFGIFGFLLSVSASFLFYVWFHILGVPYSSNTKKFITSIIVNVAEIIPGLDALQVWFVWTLGMVVIVGMVRMEDKGESPTILGGLSEGLALVFTSNPLNPVAIPLGIALSGANSLKRFTKKEVGVGEADWKKEENQRMAA